MDPLSQILDSMHLSAALAIRFHLTTPFAIEKGVVSGIPFRIGSRLPYWLRVADGEWLRVEPGDSILLPHGDRHVIASERNLPAVPVASAFSRLGLEEWVAPGRDRIDPREISFGGQGDVSTLIGGILIFSEFARMPLLQRLPSVIHIPAGQCALLPYLAASLSTLLNEVQEDSPGWSIALRRLAEVIFTQAIRAYFTLADFRGPGWLDALGDHRIGKALLLMHRDLKMDWTVQSLAEEIGMSRSRFAAKFKASLGRSPMEYLSQLRFSHAAQYLAMGESVAAVAVRTGYASDKAFSRAFRSWAGAPPRHYQRAAR